MFVPNARQTSFTPEMFAAAAPRTVLNIPEDMKEKKTLQVFICTTKT